MPGNLDESEKYFKNNYKRPDKCEKKMLQAQKIVTKQSLLGDALHQMVM